MKITEDCIDHNALCVINMGIASPFEYADSSEDADHIRLVTLGYIRGVLDLANELKAVLKEENRSATQG